MAASFRASSATWAAGTTSVAPANPAGLVAGDLKILTVFAKPGLTAVPPIFGTPAGWQILHASTQHGSAAQGTDAGAQWSISFYREHVAGDAAPTVSITNGNTAGGVIHAFQKGAGE